jgi:hypothetical protein
MAGFSLDLPFTNAHVRVTGPGRQLSPRGRKSRRRAEPPGRLRLCCRTSEIRRAAKPHGCWVCVYDSIYPEYQRVNW